MGQQVFNRLHLGYTREDTTRGDGRRRLHEERHSRGSRHPSRRPAAAQGEGEGEGEGAAANRLQTLHARLRPGQDIL